jgi:hypothetical protein
MGHSGQMTARSRRSSPCLTRAGGHNTSGVRLVNLPIGFHRPLANAPLNDGCRFAALLKEAIKERGRGCVIGLAQSDASSNRRSVPGRRRTRQWGPGAGGPRGATGYRSCENFPRGRSDVAPRAPGPASVSDLPSHAPALHVAVIRPTAFIE